jgi:hypothetical protein
LSEKRNRTHQQAEKKLHNENIPTFHYLPNIIMIIKHGAWELLGLQQARVRRELE